MDIAEVRELVSRDGKNPRVHPNGFIQIDVGEVESDWHQSHKRGHSGAALRVHIWNPPDVELPHQDTINEIHDHVFDMRSTVILGSLTQRLYEFVPTFDLEPPTTIASSPSAPTHERYTAVYKKSGDSRLEASGDKGVLRLAREYTISQGDSYTQPAFSLHDTHTPHGLVVTLMEKVEIHDGDATVICPIDQPPDNSFDRASAMNEDEIWAAIDASLR